MSTSSCPACSKQVTIPAGVGTTAKVRCPLCHSQYTLADALVNMPPLLELIEEAPAEWHDLSEPSGEQEESLAPDATLDYLPESISETKLADAAQAGAAAGFNLVGDVEEISSEEKDTEIEELGFIAPEPLVRTAPADDDPLEMAGADEDSVFDFEAQPENAAEAAGAGDNTGDADEIALDFGEPAPLEDVEEVVAFEAEAPGETIEGDELVFDMAEPQAADAPAEELADFGEEVSATGDAGEDIELDFGEPLAVASAASAAAPLGAVEAAAEEEPEDDPKAKKKKKKKEKKPREPKAPREPGQRRSLGTLVGVVGAALFAVVLSLYGVLWINPDYDFFKLGSVLPKAVLPSAMGKPKYVAAKPALPIQQPPPQQQPAADPAVPAADAPPPGETPAEVPATDPNNPAQPPAPAADEPAAPATDAPPPLEPATEGPPSAAEPEATPEKMPEKPTLAPADEPANALPAPAPEKPTATAPADEPLNPLDDAKPDAPPAEPESTEGLGPVNAAAFTLADLTKAMAAAEAADQQILAAQGASDETQLKKARSNFYLSLFRLAEAATFVKDDTRQLEGLRPQFEQIVERLAADPKRIDSLKFNAARWLDYSKRTTSGIVLAGNVVSVRQVGKLHEVKLGIGLESDEPIVTVLAAKNPGLSPGDRAFVLGGIVENPAEQLAGYQGSDAAVVWGGQFVTAAR